MSALFAAIAFIILVIAFLTLVRRSYTVPVRKQPLEMNYSRWASGITGLLPGALPGWEFAIHCAIYARGWGAGYKLEVKRLDSNAYVYEPCHFHVEASYIMSRCSDGSMTLKKYVFDVYADRFSTKSIFDAALAKLADGEDVEEITVEVPKEG